MNGLDLIYLVAGGVSYPVWGRKLRGDWRGRFGHTDDLGASARASGTPRILLHGVSVGEVNALRTLVPMLAERADVVVSVTTDTGFARAEALFAGVARVVRYPIDLSWSVRRFLDAVRPDAVGLVELEVWPNFLKACAARRVPVGVINGRLSDRSFKGYRRWKGIVGPRLFEPLAFAAVQDEAYAERFRAMGASGVVVTGSMKWDSVDLDRCVPSDRAVALGRELGIDPNVPLVVGGSTAEDEESMLHNAVPCDVQLVCAPRRPERFGDAAHAMPGSHRRTAGVPAPIGTMRFVLDTVGELGVLYELADLVVVGRSFDDLKGGGLHGSDPVEPAALGKAVVIGNRVDDFRSAVGVLEEAGGLVRATRGDVARVVRGLLGDPERRARIATAARGVIAREQGASAKHAEMLIRAAAGEPQHAD